ncbi:alanine racemase [Candidatus Endobugula sertula]|uniref:Alanine racemase n=1 Tax=Candidatus Endobugula sertula TaxID=62101 RepID=A0A1D2QLB6_9GAMM|nr:alanine racemase [Candidatus Endobugula sertula]
MQTSTKNIPSTGLLTVDLKALVANWTLLREIMCRVNSSAICAAVVKADAYGLGADQVVKALWLAGCRVFFVATVSEAIVVRKSLGNEAVIVVFGGISHGLGNEWLQYSLTPMLFQKEHITRWLNYSVAKAKKLPYAIKIDTGMHRLGLSLSEFREACVEIKNRRWHEPWLVMSHLACADDPGHPLNHCQLKEFTEAVSLANAKFSNTCYSLVNSSGLFLGEPFLFDLGRPGVALYGANPTPWKQNPMNNVVKLQVPIMQVKTISVDEGVGYGMSFIAKRVTRIAIVFGGYADGLLRALNYSGFAYCSGVKVPLVGRISMDSMIFDVTDIQGEISPVIDVLGEEQSIDDLAKYAGTIPYELLTSLGDRYKRVYVPVERDSCYE